MVHKVKVRPVNLDELDDVAPVGDAMDVGAAPGDKSDAPPAARAAPAGAGAALAFTPAETVASAEPAGAGAVPTVETSKAVQETDELEIARRVNAQTETKSPALARLLDSMDDLVPTNFAHFMKKLLTPPIAVELSIRIGIAVVLYGAVITLFLCGIVAAFQQRGVHENLPDKYVFRVTEPMIIKIESVGCTVYIGKTSGESVHVSDTTIAPVWQNIRYGLMTYSRTSRVRISEFDSCLRLTCEGPAPDEGFTASMLVEIGEDAVVEKTVVEVKASSRSSVMFSNATYGQSLTVAGDSMIAQFDKVSVKNLIISTNKGFVELRDVHSLGVNITAGAAAVSVHTKQTMGYRMHFLTGGLINASRATESVCLSQEVGGAPVQQHDAFNKTYFDIGWPVVSNITVTRTATVAAAKLGQVFLTAGVPQTERSLLNTYDVTNGADFQVDSSFATWAVYMRDVGMQLLRFRTVGPGFDEIGDGGFGGKAEWVYSMRGTVYIWHSASLFWIATLGLFSPEVARGDVVMSSAVCTASVVLPPEEACASGTELPSLGSTLTVVHAALWQALPDSMNSRSETLAELYLVEASNGVYEDKTLSNIARGKVVKYSRGALSGTDSMVSFIADSEPKRLMSDKDGAFVAMAAIVTITAPALLSLLILRSYRNQCDKIVRAQGQKLWPLICEAEKERKVATLISKPGSKLNGPLAPAAPASGPVGLVLDGTPKAVTAGSPEYFMAGNFFENVLETPESQERTASLDSMQFDVEAIRRKALEQKCSEYITKSSHLFTFLDAAILQRLPNTSKQDGLLATIGISTFHFLLIFGFCTPLYVVSFLQMFNSTALQAECGYLDLVQQSCGVRSIILPCFCACVSIASLVFCLFYTIIHYLTGRIDLLIYRDGMPPGVRMSVHRRRLWAIRSSFIFNAVFNTLAVVMVYCSIFALVGFSLYITLGACVEPQTILPFLLGIVAVIFVAKNTYARLKRMQSALHSKIADLGKGVQDAVELDAAAEEVMREMGYNDAQILLITLAACISFAAFIAFILVGCSLFMDASDVIPSLISSGLVVLSTAATIQSGEIPAQALGNSKLTGSLNQHLMKVQTVSNNTTNVVASNDAKSGLTSAKVLVADKE